MNFQVILTEEAQAQLEQLAASDARKHLKILKTLGLLATNLRSPSLQTHEFHTLSGPNGEKVFEAYVENNTPSAFRVFWYYGPGKAVITVFLISPHP